MKKNADNNNNVYHKIWKMIMNKKFDIKFLILAAALAFGLTFAVSFAQEIITEDEESSSSEETSIPELIEEEAIEAGTESASDDEEDDSSEEGTQTNKSTSSESNENKDADEGSSGTDDGESENSETDKSDETNESAGSEDEESAGDDKDEEASEENAETGKTDEDTDTDKENGDSEGNEEEETAGGSEEEETGSKDDDEDNETDSEGDDEDKSKEDKDEDWSPVFVKEEDKGKDDGSKTNTGIAEIAEEVSDPDKVESGKDENAAGTNEEGDSEGKVLVKEDEDKDDSAKEKDDEEVSDAEIAEEIDTEKTVKILNSLRLNRSDIKFLRGASNYYDILIRKKPLMKSVSLMNKASYQKEDEDEYILRSKDKFNVHDGMYKSESGAVLAPKGRWHLIDSEAEFTDTFKEAFKIRVPLYCHYGDGKKVSGIKRMENGADIIIRAYSEKYADPDARFIDNKFTVEIPAKPKPVLRVEDKGYIKGYSALNIYYEDYDSDDKVFVIYDSFFEDGKYRVLPVKHQNIVSDKTAVLIEARRNKKSGKRFFRIRLYIKLLAVHREIRVNVFDQNAKANTSPIIYKIVPKGERRKEDMNLFERIRANREERKREKAAEEAKENPENVDPVSPEEVKDETLTADETAENTEVEVEGVAPEDE